MTILNIDKIFEYIEINNDEYKLKVNTPLKVKNIIKDMVDNFEKIYNQKITIIGL